MRENVVERLDPAVFKVIDSPIRTRMTAAIGRCFDKRSVSYHFGSLRCQPLYDRAACRRPQRRQFLPAALNRPFAGFRPVQEKGCRALKPGVENPDKGVEKPYIVIIILKLL
jgi:hypothetical protein